MNFINNLINPFTGLYFGSKIKDLIAFGKNVGMAKIYDKGIHLNNYPHKPSRYYKNAFIYCTDISAVFLEGVSVSVLVKGELIFIYHELKDKLRIMAEMNGIPISIRNANWSYITEPFLDTTFSDEHNAQTIQILKHRGFDEQEVSTLRMRIEKQMMRYNFDTQLEEWNDLDLHDVLCAMKSSMSEAEFKRFYWLAMEIEMRAK